MPTSLFAPDFQAILDQAKQAAGKPTGPFPSPEDWRDTWIYFLMVDRFSNPNSGPLHQPFDDPNYFGLQGGKFSGVKQNLPYLKQLGVGAIWLAPVLKNLSWDGSTAYHGYGIHDFLRASPKFADDPANADNELRALVDAAHALGIYVIFDIVLNHTGNVFAYNPNGSPGFPNGKAVQWRDAAGMAQSGWTVIENIANPPLDALVWPKELHKNQ